MKEALVSALMMQAPDWGLPFEVMSDASDFSLGAILGQRKDNNSYAIYYANQTLDEAQVNFARTKKEFIAIGFVLEKV